MSMRFARSIATALCVGGLAFRGAHAQSPSSLSAKLAEIAKRPELVHATFGVAAYDLESKQMVFGLNAEQLFTPGSTTKLLTMGMKLGIGASLRYLRKNRSVVSKLAAPGGYDPMDLLAPMARELETLDIAALHVFTFNQVANTVAWQINVGGGASFLDNTEEVVNRGLSV